MTGQAAVGEATPLQPCHPPQATTLGTGFNMFKNIVGAGVLGLPYAMAQLGLMGLFVMFYSMSVSILALYFIIMSIDMLKLRGQKEPYSYKAIAAAAFGQNAGMLVDAVVMLYTGFGLVGYGVLLVDFFMPPLHYYFGDGPWATAPGILSVAGAMIFGLCCLPSLEALKYSSMAGNIALLYAVLLVGYEWWNSAGHMRGDMELASWSPASLKVVGIFTAAFNFHYNMPVFYCNMQPCTPRAMMSLVAVVFTFVLSFYLPMAILGYLTFGQQVESNVLRNFGNGARFLACRLGLGGMIACTFPLIVVSTRAAAGRLFRLTEPLAYHMQVTLSLLVVSAACTMACVVPSFGVVVAYNGAILGTVQQLIFPAAAFYCLSDHAEVSHWLRKLAVVVIVVGMLVAIAGTSAQTYALLSSS